MYMYAQYDSIIKEGDDLYMTKQNYALLIGKKFGDREILDIVKKKRSGVFFRYAVCKCKCGRIHEVDLCNLQTDVRAQKMPILR